mmetsp:Transcript_28607/g.77491  ORF Transcript_28607/g.77491 Transcript_28607/m.77491 type:complete len:200 (+) Transcript_28607:190-789(+)
MRLLHLEERGLRGGTLGVRAVVLVGMVLESELLVGLSDVVGGGRYLQPEHIIMALGLRLGAAAAAAATSSSSSKLHLTRDAPRLTPRRARTDDALAQQANAFKAGLRSSPQRPASAASRGKGAPVTLPTEEYVRALLGDEVLSEPGHPMLRMQVYSWAHQPQAKFPITISPCPRDYLRRSCTSPTPALPDDPRSYGEAG